MNTLQFLVQTVIGLYTFILVLRAWFQYCQVDFYNPLSQVVVKLTQPVLAPLRKLIPTRKNIDFAALVLAFVLNMLKYPLLIGSFDGASLWQFAVIGVLAVVKAFGEMIFWAILIRAVMSWFSQGNHPLEYQLYRITEPLLAPIRRILPNTGMIDFSVMALAFILIFGNKLLMDLFGSLWVLA
ncbi:YggT family protein [Pasteurella testudinis DSM 23072]|uniref:YggT family protein n=1 Tax=Pasteurella testudinis DSM 23072 TaxID=1122938 RepID=A0A1W1UUN2_9PAST|nr:YggT family protein [Pasteurella testudinis]SMB84531.1 YggT family protein [Pasteurella testudinis DSM 23072]SUB52946.1 putative transmembrane protein [Pasteurella testudinis]